ncbi:MAG: PAS domain-containing protein [Rhizobacter sp.]|nr:PAS domain-containing protein [Rhizobacter sp.]
MNDTFGRDTAYHMRRLVDHLPSMLAYWDRDLLCRFANRAYERWFGVNPDQLVGTSIRDLLGPELFALNEPYIRGALRGEEQVFERVVPGPGGVRRHSLATYVPDIVNGEVMGFMAHVTEVTKLKETEAALRTEVAERTRANEQLRHSEAALLEAQRLGQIGSWEWEVEPDIITWSAELYQIFGCDPTLLPPRYAEQAKLYTPESWAKVGKAVSQALDTGQPYTLELEYHRPGGGTGWVEARAEAERDDTGAVVRLHGTVLEITVRREAQDARLQRDLADAASRNKTLLLSRASHELRTPLNAVLGFAQLCEVDPALPPKHREWAGVIKHSGQHMLGLVEDMLDLSSAELGEMRMACTELDLGELVRASLPHLALLANQAQVRFIDNLPQALPLRIMGDPQRVRQVVDNLLSNAIKYNREGGSVALSASVQGAMVALRVEDSGAGLSAAQLQRLFTPFDRLGAEATAIKGTGMGLALTKKLVELMGGQIRVESLPGMGSVFTVALPAAGS